MDSEKKFRTKTGYCHILPDRIVMTSDGITGNIDKVTNGNFVFKPLIIYGLISIGLIYLSIDDFIKHNNFNAIVFLLIAGYLIYGILNSLNNSATPVIDRQSIQQIKFTKGIPGITRSRFVVLFTEETGKIKKRLILLPGLLTGGKTETDIAYNLMIAEKLIEK